MAAQPNLQQKDDIFDSSLNLEQTHYNSGYASGYSDGLSSGKEEARLTGISHGFQIGEELGFYGGCLDIWNSAVKIDTDQFSDRVKARLKTMETLLEKYPILEPEDERLEEMMDSLRLQFKKICASLNVKFDKCNGYSRTHDDGIGF